MAKLGTIALTGKSGTEYPFNVWPRTDRFAAVGAVYFMTHRKEKTNGGGTHTFVYVGETVDLSDRPLNHERQPCFDTHNANCVMTYAEENKTKRLEIETDLRRAYDPPCNRQ